MRAESFSKEITFVESRDLSHDLLAAFSFHTRLPALPALFADQCRGVSLRDCDDSVATRCYIQLGAFCYVCSNKQIPWPACCQASR